MRDRYPTLSVRLKRARLLAGAWLLVLAGGVFGGEAAAATPSITSISPESGDAYERVRITGTGFGSSRGTSTVTFGGTRASRYHQWRDTEIEVRPPASLAYGANAVVVTVGGQASNRVTYTRLPRLTAYCRTPGSGLSEPSGTFDIRVHRAGGTREAVTVALAYGGTATLGADYTGPATVTIAARERNGTATLRVVDDTGREGNEQITYEVSAEGYLGSSCTLTLGDDDPDGTAAPGVRINPSQLTVREGEAGSYAVVLATEPAADVTVGVAAPRGVNLRVEPSSLTFTSRNWSTPQRVTVTEPEDDDAVSEDHTLTHTAASTDSNYNGVSVAGVALRVVDDDLGRAFVRFDPNRVTINEGETGSYTVVLATQPTADVTIPVEVPLGASLAAEPSSLTFTSRNWSTPQTVTVAGLEDDDQVDSAYIMSYRSISRDREYSNAATEWSQITVIDDDGPGVRIDPEELTVREGEAGSYAVVLVTRPTADVTIAVAAPREASLRVEPTSLTFTSRNWSTPQTVTVTALEDADAAGGTHSIDHLALSRDPDYFGLFMDLISVTVIDNDPAAPGVRISPSQLTVREGEAGSYAVVLATEPAADVTIAAAAPQGVNLRVEPSSLTFTSRNWSTPQRVTVTEPEDDDAVSEDHTLTHTAASTDSNYNGVSVAGVAVRVVDDDLGRAFVRFDPNRVTINEGETGSYTVVLATQPTADVTIPVEVPLGASLRAEPWWLTFTSRNWSTPQTVTVTALEDDDQVDSPYIMSYRSISRDREYSNAATEWSQITVIDDDGPGVRIDPEELTVREGETGSYAVVLVTQPRADVTIPVAVPEEASLRAEPSWLTFTSRNWSTPQTVTVTALEDDDAAGGTHSLDHLAWSRDPDYFGIFMDLISVTVVDNDPAAPGVRINPSQLTVREGEAGSYAVVLVTRPAADVTIGVAAPRGVNLRVEPSSLTFTSRNWSTPQRVTVTEPEDDDAVSEDHTLTHTAASTDSNYNGVSVAGVALRVVDDDLGRAFVRFDPNRVTINEGDTGSYAVVLATQPTADVTIPVEVPLGASLAAEPSWLTFTSRNWSTPQTVTVTALEDDDQVDSAYIMSYRSISRDREYSNAATEWSQITVIDDDGPGVRIDPEELTVREGEAGSYAVVLVTRPTADVTIAVAAPREASLRVEPTSLTFTSRNWSTPQTVTVTALEDADAAGGTHSIDHLALSRDPDYFGLFMDLISVTVIDNDPAAPGVRISPSQLTVREGEAGSYAVVLATEPAADVTIAAAAPRGVNLRVEPSSLTFTSRNWSTPQRVTVTEPEDDDAVSEDHTLTHTAASTDSNYNGVSVAGVAVRVVDDDLGRAFVRFDPNRVTINEGETGSYTVVLATQPTADVTIPVEVPRGASLRAEPSWLTFTSRNWSTPQTVTVAGLEDDDQVDSPYIMSYRSISRDREYSNAATEWSQITVIDDDGPGVRIDPEELTVREGETGSYALVLVTQPRADVTIAVAAPEEASVRVEPTSLTFTSRNWSTPQTVTVTALEDDDAAGGTHSLDHLAWSRDPDYFGIFMDLISVTVVDNDPAAPGVRINPSQLTVREGEAGSYAVVLVTRPAADVTIGVAAPQGVNLRVEPSSLTFTSRNWSTPQRVTVTEPEDDDAVSEDHTLTHTAASTDSNYNGVSVAGVALRVVDDDLGRAFVRFDPNRVTINEGDTGSYAVVLATQPTADVTIPVEVPLGASLRAEPSWLTFTSRNWSTPQTVTVTALEDDDQVDSAYIMSYRSISRDREYSNAATEWSQITVIDDDGPGVRIDPEELTVREGETGRYALVLVTQPRADVTIAVAVPQEASVRVEPTSLTFTSRNWSTPQTVTVTALEDDDQVSENHTLTHTAASTDSSYNGVSVDGVALTVVDNDTGAPGVMISPSQLTVREGEAGSYAVVLTARPTHAVTVVMEPPSDGKLSVSPESLAFSTTDWSAAQTVRVTAHEDGDKADGTMSLGHRVESADGNYQGVAAGSVQVGVTDDDELEVRVSPTRLTIAEGGEGSYTLVMVEEPPRGLTVTIGNPDGSKLRISPESVEFTSGENGNWNQPQTVTVTALQDAAAVSEKLRITHEAAFVAGTVTAKEYIYIGSRLLAIEPGGGVAPQLSFDDVRVEITDDEASAAGLTVSPGRPAIAEGYTGSYTVAPNSRPTHPGTLTLEVSPASLSFSRSNRRRPQGVSLPAAADGGSAAHFGATRDTVNFGAQSAAIESWGAGTIVALAPLHLPEGGTRARANSRAGNGVTATGNPFHRERDEVECEALENCPEDEEEDSPPDP